MVGAQDHGLVDVLHGGGAGLHQADGVVDHGDQQLVDHEARRLLHFHGVLVQLLGQVIDKIKGLVGGVDAPDDLHQLHGGHGVEEVHADQGVLQTVSHVGDGQGRGVGGKGGIGLADIVQLHEQLLLDVHVLLDALDDQIDVGGLFMGLGDQNVGQQSILGLRGHLALVHPLLQGLGQGVLVPLGGRRAAGVHQNGMTLGGKHLGNAPAHGAGAE